MLGISQARFKKVKKRTLIVYLNAIVNLMQISSYFYFTLISYVSIQYHIYFQSLVFILH